MFQDTPAPTVAPVTTNPRRALPRRLYRISEAAAAVSLPEATARYHVWRNDLPTLVLPTWHDGATRRVRCVPAVWLPRWLDMRDRTSPVYTSQADVLQLGAGDPFYMPVAAAAEILGVGENWLYRAIQSGVFPRPASDGVDMRVGRVTLDRWVYDLIQDAEREWYGAAERTGVLRVMPRAVGS